MKVIETTYRTFNGIQKILEIPKKKFNQCIIYQDDNPKFYVDFYDLEKESNCMMNSLILLAGRSLEEVLTLINKKNNINLSIPKISSLVFKMKLKSEFRELDLDPLPEEWLSYSL
tara:strand:+ start:322 stop:666 length:345 start_codon:yes stop_codon:yes gene_type:complete